MKFAIALPTDAETWRGGPKSWAFRAPGSSTCRLLSADPFVAMAAAALETTRIRLGTGALSRRTGCRRWPRTPLPRSTSSPPGRIDFGVGAGFTGRRARGLGTVKLADRKVIFETITALLRGETVEAVIEGRARLIRLLNPELGLVNTHHPIGLYVAASGPRARALTAGLGANWIATIGDAALLRELEVSGQEHAIEDWGRMRRAFV